MPRKLISALLVTAALVLIVGVLFLLRPRGTIAGRTAATAAPREGLDVPVLGASTLPVADVTAYDGLHAARTNPRDDVRIVAALIQNFQQSMTSAVAPPLGFNEEITRALTGINPLDLAFLPSTHPAINRRGLLCDRWGTPYHFHPLAADRIDVRSAGPDQKLFTADDVQSETASSVSGPAADATVADQ